MAGVTGIFDCVAVPVVGLDSQLRVLTANRNARAAFSDAGRDVDIETQIFKKTGLRK